MNHKVVTYALGWVLFFEGCFLFLPFLVGLCYQEYREAFSFLGVAGGCALIGWLITRFRPKDMNLFAREGYVIVAFSWLILSLFGAIPFMLTGSISNFMDAIFETASGFTTTGASILASPEDMPKCINFWRTFTHWIGGMGVLVFMMAVIPLAGGRNMFLMKAESPGPTVGKFVPKVKSSAKILYSIYLVMTILQVVFLMFGGLSLFDSVTAAFGTAGTGGFGVYNDSIGGFSTYCQVIITIFMIAYGVNFSFYYLVFVARKPKEALKIKEVWIYLTVIAGSILLITCQVRPQFLGWGETLKHAAFQVGSIVTTTGYSTVDFDQWPAFSKTILFFLMFMGACAGSTGGGMKVSRFMIWVKTFLKELKVMIHPRNVYKVKVAGQKVEHEVLRSVNVFLVSYMIIFIVSVLLISLDGYDFETNVSAVAATINNIGPGFKLVGPTCNYSGFSTFSTAVLIFDMIAGRLELFPLLLLFSPTTWKK